MMVVTHYTIQQASVRQKRRKAKREPVYKVIWQVVNLWLLLQQRSV